MRLPTDVKPHPSGVAAILGVAVLLLAVFQTAGFIYFGHQAHLRNAQIAELTAQLHDTENALAHDDATLAAIHRELTGKITAKQLREVRRQSAPRTVMIPSPVPGPTVTVRPTPAPRPSRRHHTHPSPSPSCTSVQVLTNCAPPVPSPSLHLQ